MICILRKDEHGYILEPHWGDEPSCWLSPGGLKYLRKAGWGEYEQHRVSAWLINALLDSDHLRVKPPPIGSFLDEFVPPTPPCSPEE